MATIWLKIHGAFTERAYPVTEKQPNTKLSNVDRKLLNLLQSKFPLTGRPYLSIAKTLVLSEKNVIARVASLKKRGIIRRIGGSFNSGALGFISTLVAMEVEKQFIETVASAVNAYSGVTHNYQRDHVFNIWFTLISKDLSEQEKIISEIKNLPGVNKVRNLPAQKVFKLGVNFKLNEGQSDDSK
jgi:siroheme decarboxylase